MVTLSRFARACHRRLADLEGSLLQLKYMGWPGTHQRMKGFSNPPVRTTGTPVQFDSIYGLPVRYSPGARGSRRAVSESRSLGELVAPTVSSHRAQPAWPAAR